jgi:hypothetical protein
MTELDGKKLKSKAKKKYVSSALAKGLVKVNNSPLNYKYAQTFGCCDIMTVGESGELKSQFYCGNRWCATCQSIKMATLIDKYHPMLINTPDLYFVTLTLRTVEAEKLQDRYDYMTKTWREITDLARKQKRVDFMGIRKTETTAAKNNLYHTHFHVLISGRYNAFWLLGQWMARNVGLAEFQSQCVKKVREVERALIEVLKYATKMSIKDGDKEIAVEAWRLDIIYRAMYRKRLIQAFGGIKQYQEDEMELSSEVVKKARGLYAWCGSDWYHTEFHQQLTNYIPDQETIKITRAWIK